jgi:hypothetical protein
MWEYVDNIAKTTNLNQFVFINLPEHLPSLTVLNTYSSKQNLAMVKIFDTPEELALLHFWRWLGVEHRESSAMKVLSKDTLGKINIIFTSPDNKSSIVNLGYLDNWIKTAENESDHSVTRISPVQMQKIFLKYAMVLEEGMFTEQQIPPEEESFNPEGSKLINVPEEDAISYAAPKAKDLPEVSDEPMDDGKDLLTRHLEELEGDLDSLEVINKKRLKDRGLHLNDEGDVEEVAITETPTLPYEAVADMVLKEKTYEEVLKEQIDEQAEYGLLSASEYKKLSKEINSYKELQDPWRSKQSIGTAMVITKEDLELSPDKITISDSDSVLDKSMLQSTLLSFDEDYITKVMHKDILSMVAGIQTAGVIVKRHEVERDISALGTYDNHTIELKPIDGASSTLRFRLPVVNKDGTFLSGGNKYLQRKQKVD